MLIIYSSLFHWLVSGNISKMKSKFLICHVRFSCSVAINCAIKKLKIINNDEKVNLFINVLFWQKIVSKMSNKLL